MRSRTSVGLLCTLALLGAIGPVRAANSAATITVDALAMRHPIDSRIYGLAYADAAALDDLNCPLNRRGGNNTSRYNWQANADNRANDWYYESIGYASSSAGADADDFVGESLGSASAPMLTVPTVGWVAKLGPGRSKLSSYSIARYGAQTGSDWQWFPDAGNGVRTNGQYVTGNDPNDASVPADSAFQQAWIQHLAGRWGAAASGGVKYYILDNEPSIWHATHRDVHPTGATMDEIRDKCLDYAARIKAVDPNALVLGPEEWGWSGYFWSGYDQQYYSQHGWGVFPDREAHNNWDYLPWLLDQFRQNDAGTGRRLIDVFTVHYYPQGGEFSNDTSTAMQLRRNRSTRSLWDPNYIDETWINDTVKLVPRLRQWVDTYYPGTAIGVTEYNWGAENHMNGATAQADVLGIFGREGLDVATRWTTPAAGTPVYNAIRMYRNYDGNRATFGDSSCLASVPNPDELSAFAALRSTDGAMTIMVVNKALSASTPVTVSLTNFLDAGAAQVWQLANGTAITRLADVAVSSHSISTTVPPQSVTLFVVAAAAAVDTPGIYAPSSSAFFLRNFNSPGAANVVFTYGAGGAGLTALAGDWDGDGATTPGLYDPMSGAFFLKNTNAGGGADAVFTYGPGASGFVPVVGDWDGNGTETVGLYDPAHGLFFLKNANTSGGADIVFGFGPAAGGWIPLAGDWDGNGTDTVGLYVPSSGAFFLRNTNTPGAADKVFSYGPPNAVPLVGDWNGDGSDTIGVYVSSSGAWFLRNSSSAGAADVVYLYGPPNMTPLVGNWDGQ